MQNKKLKLSDKDKETLKQIKQTILNTAKEMNIEIDKIILFGSRARGDYKEDSDWDILIVTKRKLSKEKKMSFLKKIHINFAFELNIHSDIILSSRNNYEKSKTLLGNVFYETNKEGVIL